jgi:hypothetical protein
MDSGRIWLFALVSISEKENNCVADPDNKRVLQEILHCIAIPLAFLPAMQLGM